MLFHFCYPNYAFLEEGNDVCVHQQCACKNSYIWCMCAWAYKAWNMNKGMNEEPVFSRGHSNSTCFDLCLN